MRIGNIKDDEERGEAEEVRAAAVDARGRSRADTAAQGQDIRQERLDLYVAVHGGGEPSNEVARKWVASEGGIQKARKLAK